MMSILIVINFILIIVLNPIAESIYIRGEYYTSAYSHCVEFMKENFLLWIIPFIIYLILLRILGLSIENYILTSNIIDIPLGLNTESLVVLGFDIQNLKQLLIIVLTGVYAIFRGCLYKILHNSTRRKRAYMGEI